MKFLGLDVSLSRKAEAIPLNTLLQRLEAVYETSSGITVTPDNCMQSPTVHAIVTTIARRMASLPVHVMRKSATSEGRTIKEKVPNHPVQRLLDMPNNWQTKVDFWLDATSWFLRYGNFYAYKARGQTGPILRLEPIPPYNCKPSQANDLTVTYGVTKNGGDFEEYPASQILHVRGAARDGVEGDSPVMDLRETIAMEIAAEKVGASFFGNSALPSVIFEYAEGFKGYRTPEERDGFIDDFQRKYGGRNRYRALVLPNGLKIGATVTTENEKAQFLETRQYQRTVIAGGFGVPVHLVGDLQRGTYNNVEQQTLDFVVNVILPVVRAFEASMERDLLTPEDRRAGVIIRFNLEGALRADFKTRQEGLKIQREMGVISANDWRDHEDMNPLAVENGGEEIWRQGPSGQSANQNATSEPPPAE